MSTISQRLAGLIVMLCALAAACGSGTEHTASSTGATSPTTGALPSMPDTAHDSCSADAVALAVPDRFKDNGFDRYFELVLDGEVAMRYLVQPSLSHAQVEHAIRTTRWYLTDAPGTTFGADKSNVISTLASNEGTIVIPDGTHVEGRDLGVDGQELYANEIAAPGSTWYVSNNPEHRDATLEEVFHQVHDAGIGTNRPGALPGYQRALESEANLAKDDGRWATGETGWIADLTQEGSLAQEYIASVIDNYYGLWAHEPGGSGYYAYGTRADLVAGDPTGATLLRQFLGDTVETEAYIDPVFDGIFSLAFSDDISYSHKSQYLRGARLTGANASGIVGNALDNTLRGNAADNDLDGGDGVDTAIYCMARDAYTVTTNGDVTTIVGPDGSDSLTNIESVHFADGPTPIPMDK